MYPKRNRDLLPTARQLRKNMTAEERKLWYEFLRFYPVRISRQKILGRYIADFYCAKANLVIEIDGSQHATNPVLKHDADRTWFMEGYGLTVLRIPNCAIRDNFPGVCTYLDQEIQQRL